MSIYSARVTGIPAPQGSKRAYIIPAKGPRKARANLVESSSAVKPWRAAVVRDWAAAGHPTAPGAVSVLIDFRLPRPKAHYGTGRNAGKIRAAVDARRESGTLIMARTDAAAVHGFNAAVDRAQAFAEAGADILFVEAVTREEEVRALPQRLDRPQLMNMVIGGKTPIFGADELGQLGFGFVLYANAALQSAVAGMQNCLTLLRDKHQVDEDPAIVAPFLERQRLVNKDFWDALEQKYT